MFGLSPLTNKAPAVKTESALYPPSKGNRLTNDPSASKTRGLVSPGATPRERP